MKAAIVIAIVLILGFFIFFSIATSNDEIYKEEIADLEYCIYNLKSENEELRDIINTSWSYINQGVSDEEYSSKANALEDAYFLLQNPPNDIACP